MHMRFQVVLMPWLLSCNFLLLLQRAAITFDDSQPQADELQCAADEDDLLADYLSPQQDRQVGRASGKAGKQRSPSPLLIDLEVPAAGTSTAAAAGADKRGKRKAAAAAGAGAGATGTDVKDPMRAAAEQQRALRQALASATHAADDDGDEIEILDSDGEQPCHRTLLGHASSSSVLCHALLLTLCWLCCAGASPCLWVICASQDHCACHCPLSQSAFCLPLFLPCGLAAACLLQMMRCPRRCCGLRQCQTTPACCWRSWVAASWMQRAWGVGLQWAQRSQSWSWCSRRRGATT